MSDYFYSLDMILQKLQDDLVAANRYGAARSIVHIRNMLSNEEL